MRRLLFACLVVGACAPSAPPATVAPNTRPTAVVLVSLDGFHPDYLTRGVTPRISALAARGVRARWMEPSFPTKTFPNHYTIVTGLTPDHHGIVANNMQDSVLGSFSMSNAAAVTNAAWWGGEPIWVTAALQGKRSAAFFWPGSEAPIKGVRPTHWQRFDDVFPREARVDSVLAWLDVPADRRPVVSTLYYSDVDWAGHRFGPASAQVDTALMRVDEMVGRLVDGLAARGLDDEVNVILVSDHGMTPSPASKLIHLDDYIALDDVEVVDWTPVGKVQPKPGRGDSVYARLRGAHPALQVYWKREVPARYRFGTHPRVSDLVLVADEGWTITARARAARFRDGGSHGYDNALASMRALFVAAGPAFREGVVVPAFSNVHVYELMTAITGLRPAPNDGARDSTAAMLRGWRGAAPDTLTAAERIARDTRELAGDRYEGRFPGTRGDTLATAYLRERFAAAGLAPGGAGGSWDQPVSLVGVRGGGSVTMTGPSGSRRLAMPDEVVVPAGRGGVTRTLSDLELVFVGHGIVTGDGAWDDYKDVDVRGKAVVMLDGLPAGDAWRARGARLLPGLKRRVAESRGAAAMITIASEAAFRVNRAAALREVIVLDLADSVPAIATVVAHPSTVTTLLGAARSEAAWRAMASDTTFRPMPMVGRATIAQAPARRPFTSPNIVGVLPGSDAARRDEVVMVIGHWDHVGRDTTLPGDQIFNGALDNAIGTAQLLEMAHQLVRGPRPARSLLFVATTAEEAGLLGARWYARHPLRPLAQTLAVVNLDFGQPWGPTRDVISIGDGMTSLDSTLAVAAAVQGRRISPDLWPEQGFYQRSDHFAFAEVGVPGLFASGGVDFVGREPGWGKAQLDDYLLRTYHRPNDEVQAWWDFTGVAEDVALLVDVVRRVANAEGRPTWNAAKPESAPYRAAAARLR